MVDESGRDVGPGEAGEGLVKGPLITQGYYKNPEANAATFTADGWLRTGDVMRIVNNLVYVVDRKKVGRRLVVSSCPPILLSACPSVFSPSCPHAI